MKLSTLRSKLTGMKAKVLAGTAITAAGLMMAAPAAQAQRVYFGVRVGAPVYVAPAPVYVAPAPPVVYAGPGYYGGVYFRDYNGWRAHYWDHRFDRRHFR